MKQVGVVKRRGARLLAILLSIATALAFMPAIGGVQEAQAAAEVARIGDAYYDKLAEAIAAAGPGKTEIVMVNDTVESVTIPKGADITLDLNGKTVSYDGTASGVNASTIENRGNLVLTSNNGEGVVKNATTEETQFACVLNAIDATAEIKGGSNNGTVKILRESDSYTNNVKRNGYNIYNMGNMTIDRGVTVHNTATTSASSTINTGFYTLKDDILKELIDPEAVPVAELIIKGGTITGGKNAIKVDSSGSLKVYGGEITGMEFAVLNWNKTEIYGGTFSVTGAAGKNSAVIKSGKFDWDKDDNYRNVPHPSVPTENGEIVIKGGKFIVSDLGTSKVFMTNGNTDGATVSIKDGTFDGELGSNLAPKMIVTVEGGKYKYDFGTNATIPEEKILVQDDDNYFTLHDAVTVTFDPAGGKFGEGAKESVKIEKGTKVTAPTVTKTDYNHKGWQVKGETDLFNFDSPVNETMTLIAVWVSVADEEAAQRVTVLINGLPGVEELTLDDKDEVDNVNAEYEKLTDDQKALVDDTAKEKLKDAVDKIDELSAEKALKDAKDAAIEELSNYKTLEDLQKYDDSGKSQITKAVNDGIEEIKDATTIEGVSDALDKAKNAIDAVPTKADNELDQAKKDAKDELDKVNPGDYSGEEKSAVEKAIEDGKKAIDDAKTIDEVNKAKEDAQKKIADQKTDAQKAKEEADKKAKEDAEKEAAKTELENEVKKGEDAIKGDNRDDYTPDSVKALEDAINKAKEVANNPNSTKDDIDKANKAVEQAITNLVKITDIKNIKEIEKLIPAEVSAKTPAPMAAVEALITKMTSDKDIKGSKYAPLKYMSKKQTKNSIKLQWSKVKGAQKYVIFANQCNAKGKKYKMKKLATVKANKKAYTVKKILKKKLKKNTFYKFIIVAQKGKKAIAISKTIHVSTAGKKKYGNHKNVTVAKKVIKKAKKIKKGKKLALKAKAVAPKGKKVTKHVGVRYETTNKKVATVNAKGVVKGKKKGTCYIYAYAQNGIAKKIKVTIK